MPIPSPRKLEKKTDFISRCMGDKVMNKEYEQDQRYAICLNKWKDKKKAAVYAFSMGGEEYVMDAEVSQF